MSMKNTKFAHLQKEAIFKNTVNCTSNKTKHTIILNGWDFIHIYIQKYNFIHSTNNQQTEEGELQNGRNKRRFCPLGISIYIVHQNLQSKIVPIKLEFTMMPFSKILNLVVQCKMKIGSLRGNNVANSPNVWFLLLEQKGEKRLNQFLRKAKVSSELEVRRLETRLPLLVDKRIFQSLNSRHLYQTCSSQTSQLPVCFILREDAGLFHHLSKLTPRRIFLKLAPKIKCLHH